MSREGASQVQRYGGAQVCVNDGFITSASKLEDGRWLLWYATSGNAYVLGGSEA